MKEIQASDFNSEKLAALAVKFSPEGVEKILREELVRRRETMDKWLRQADSKYRASPYDVNSKPCPYCADSFASERDLRTHIISFHGERPISLARG